MNFKWRLAKDAAVRGWGWAMRPAELPCPPDPGSREGLSHPCWLDDIGPERLKTCPRSQEALHPKSQSSLGAAGESDSAAFVRMG